MKFLFLCEISSTSLEVVEVSAPPDKPEIRELCLLHLFCSPPLETWYLSLSPPRHDWKGDSGKVDCLRKKKVYNPDLARKENSIHKYQSIYFLLALIAQAVFLPKHQSDYEKLEACAHPALIYFLTRKKRRKSFPPPQQNDGFSKDGKSSSNVIIYITVTC